MKIKLTDEQRLQYLEQLIELSFKPLIEEQVYSSILDIRHSLVICTRLTAQSIGLKDWHEAVGLSFRDYACVDIAKRFFKQAYNHETSVAIHNYGHKIFKIQQYVFDKRKVASFVDLLPYDNLYKYYQMTFVPLFHPDGEVVGIQTFAVECKFSTFHGHQTKSMLTLDKAYHAPQNLSIREEEILFLLAYGMTQQQIAQILDRGRGTIGVIIKNQLCVKFGLSGSNTKLLGQIAVQHGYHKKMPKSLWRPSVIIMEDELLNYMVK